VRLLSSMIARLVAMATPLSAPEVVRWHHKVALAKTSSNRSFLKSWTLSWFFSQTMSRWPCRQTRFTFSRPGERGFRTTTLPTCLLGLEAKLLRLSHHVLRDGGSSLNSAEIFAMAASTSTRVPASILRSLWTRLNSFWMMIASCYGFRRRPAPGRSASRRTVMSSVTRESR